MKLYKKILLFVILPIIAFSLLGTFLYLRSDLYYNKLAIKDRQVNLDRLNSIERKYIKPGVYSLKREIIKNKSSVDKFGNTISETTVVGYSKYEIAFTDTKLVILNTKSNIKEEIIFNNSYLIYINIDDNSFRYKFEPLSWQIIDNTDGMIMVDLLEKFLDENGSVVEYPITLTVKDGDTPFLSAWYNFRITHYDGTYYPLETYREWRPSAGIHSISILYLENLEHSYGGGLTPDYVKSAKYPDWVYKVDSY
jgi:hypothetical protein